MSPLGQSDDFESERHVDPLSFQAETLHACSYDWWRTLSLLGCAIVQYYVVFFPSLQLSTLDLCMVKQCPPSLEEHA